MPQEQGTPPEGPSTGPFDPLLDAPFGDLDTYDVWGGDVSIPQDHPGEDRPGAGEQTVMPSVGESTEGHDGNVSGVEGAEHSGREVTGASPTTLALVAAVLLAVIAGSLWATSRRSDDVGPGPAVAVSAPDTEPHGTPDFSVATRDRAPVGTALPPPAPELAPAPSRPSAVPSARPVASRTGDDAAPSPSASSQTPTSTAPPTPDPGAQAVTELQRAHAADRSATVFDGRWVAQLASWAGGAATASPPDAPDTAEAILAEHRALRDRFGPPVRLLTEADLARGGQATRWISVYAPATFASHDDAAAWCGHQAAASSCSPRQLPTAS